MDASETPPPPRESDRALAEGTSSTPFPQRLGSFLLLRRLGGGAAGVVYEAEQDRPRRRIALKVLHLGFDASPDVYERFLREVEACASVHHPHVVPILESGEVEGRPYLVMPLLNGRDLRQRIESGLLETPAEACQRAAGVADALHALHERGIVHRDLKPSNILVQEDGSWTLADFGLARTADARTLTRTGDPLGTPLYMSPEQVCGERAEMGPRTDVYGLGAILYEALTGTPPHEAEGIRPLMHKILTDCPESPRVRNPEVPVSCARVVMKCLERRPADRYASARDLATDLRRVGAGSAAHGRPVPAIIRHVRSWIDRPWRTAGSAALVLVPVMVWAFLASRPAHFRIHTVSGATLSVNGGPFEPVPSAFVEVPSGRLEARIRHEHFQEGRFVRDMAPGSVVEASSFALTPIDEADPVALRLLLELVGMDIARLPLPAERGHSPSGLHLLYPGGRVGPSDLDRFALEPGLEIDEVPGRKTIVWRRGEEVLARLPLGEETSVEGAVPEAVRRALAPGEVLVWGIHAGEEALAEVKVEVVEDSDALPPARLGALLEAPALESVPGFRAAIRARALLEADRPYTAWRQLVDVLGHVPPTSLLLRLQLAALHRMHASGQAPDAIRASGLWFDTAEELAYLERTRR